MTIDFNDGGGGSAELPDQVTSGERTAGTETDLRSFSPADVAAMATIHGPGGTPTAAGVSFSPVGGLSATNVQDMGAELDSEKISNSALGVTVESFAGAASQLEAEAGLVTAKRTWSPERINQAIQALAPARPVDFVSNVDSSTILGRATAGNGPSEELTAAQVRTLINVENGATADQTDAEIEAAYNAQVSVISQAEAEAGTSTVVRRWTAQRVAQAIAALGGGGGGSFALPTRNDDSTETVPVTTDTRVSITTATITKTLPTSPTDGVFVAITLDAVTAGTGRVTISRGGTNTIDWKGVQINSVVLAEVGDRVVFCFDGDNGRWRLVYDGIKGPYLHARRITSDQTMTANTYDLVEWNQALVDYHGILDTSTNVGRITPTIPGVYLLEPVLTTENQINGIRELKTMNLYVNGSSEVWGSVSQFSDSEHQKENFSYEVNGSSDYLEIYYRAYSQDHVLFAYNAGTNRRTEMRVRRIK